MVEPTHMYLGVAVFFTSIFLIAHYGHMRTGRGAEEYYIAGRRVGGFISALTYGATTYSAFMMIGLVGFTWAGGVGALGFELIYLMGTAILLLIFAPRFLFVGRRFGYLTPAQLLSDRYQNRAVGVVTTILCLTFLIPYISVQATGASLLMGSLTRGGIPYEAGLLFIVAVMGVIAWWGGMRGVAWSDATQALVMLVTALAFLFYVVHAFLGGWQAFFSAVEVQSPEMLTTPGPNAFFNFPKFLGLTLPWFFFAITNPQVSQRLFIPKSMTALRSMIMGFLAFGFIYTIITTLFGFAARLIYPTLDKADLAMPTLLAEKAPTIVALIITLGILAAAVTTANSIMLSLGSMVARDVYRATRIRVTEVGEMMVGRTVILLMAIALIAFAWRPLGLIAELSVLSSAGLLVQVPMIIGAFFWRRGTAYGAVSSMMVGGIVTATLYFYQIYPLGQWPAVWGLLTSTAIFIAVSLLSKPPSKADEFIETVNEVLRKKTRSS